MARLEDFGHREERESRWPFDIGPTVDLQNVVAKSISQQHFDSSGEVKMLEEIGSRLSTNPELMQCKPKNDAFIDEILTGRKTEYCAGVVGGVLVKESIEFPNQIISFSGTRGDGAAIEMSVKSPLFQPEDKSLSGPDANTTEITVNEQSRTIHFTFDAYGRPIN